MLSTVSLETLSNHVSKTWAIRPRSDSSPWAMLVARPTLVFNMCATWSTKVQQSTIAKKNIYNDLKNREAIDWNLIELLNKYDVQQSQQPVHVSMVFHAFCLCHSWEVSSKIKGHTSFRSPNSWPRSWSWPRSMDSMDSPAVVHMTLLYEMESKWQVPN